MKKRKHLEGRANVQKAAFRATVSFNRADVLRENIEAVFAACDAAHGRWTKLLGVRALLHPRLRLQDFLQIYNMTKLKAMLDQETWVEVDVPNEFQGIMDSLSITIVHYF
uniref:Uncharacterized protein n=1 Tax=Lactuca sativa TaxID=4236 RepID=A0A9R1XKS7_LACSA|nr:hypothetical protein LSAT_V11C400173590 [Lactuca sativa]